MKIQERISFTSANDDEHGHVSQRNEQIERKEMADSY